MQIPDKVLGWGCGCGWRWWCHCVWLTKRLTDYTCICFGSGRVCPVSRFSFPNMLKDFKLLTLRCSLLLLVRLCACDKFGLLKGVSAWNDVCQLHECPYPSPSPGRGRATFAALHLWIWVELTAIMQIRRRTALIPVAMSLVASRAKSGRGSLWFRILSWGCGLG